MLTAAAERRRHRGDEKCQGGMSPPAPEIDSPHIASFLKGSPVSMVHPGVEITGQSIITAVHGDGDRLQVKVVGAGKLESLVESHSNTCKATL